MGQMKGRGLEQQRAVMDGERERKQKWWMRENAENDGATASQQNVGDRDRETQEDFIFSAWDLIYQTLLGRHEGGHFGN